LSEPTTITVIVVGFAAFLALIALLRILLRKNDPGWRRIRIGFFIERDPKERNDS
jgi:hypothetical protein